MKRLLKIGGATLGVLVLSVAAALALAVLGRRGVPETFEISGIRVLQDGMVSLAVVPTGPREVVLIDAGNDAAGRVVLDELSRRGLGPEAVSAIVMTHGHPDHVAAVAAFPKAIVMALVEEVPLIEGRSAARGPLPRFFPARPTGVTVGRPLRDGETLALGTESITVFAVPGHTAGSAAYLVRDVLFLGDSADADREGRLQGAPWVFSDSQAQNRASLVNLGQRLLQDGVMVKAIVFAHSGALTEGLGPLTAFARENP